MPLYLTCTWVVNEDYLPDGSTRLPKTPSFSWKSLLESVQYKSPFLSRATELKIFGTRPSIGARGDTSSCFLSVTRLTFHIPRYASATYITLFFSSITNPRGRPQMCSSTTPSKNRLCLCYMCYIYIYDHWFLFKYSLLKWKQFPYPNFFIANPNKHLL